MVIAIVGLVITIGMGAALSTMDFSTYRIARNMVSIETVKHGAMEVAVSANGTLLSDNIEDLAAQVTGRVTKLYLKPGAHVKVGEHLVDLSNPTLVTNAEEAQSAWEGSVKELEATRAQLHIDLQNEEMALVQARFAMEETQQKYKAEKKIENLKIIPELEFGHTTYKAMEAKELYRIKQQSLKSFRVCIKAKLEAAEAHVAQLAGALDRARNQVANLQVVAGISGIVQAIDVQVGQQLQLGASIGRIAQQDDLYAELKVPARDAAAVSVGQNALIDTHDGIVKGVVKRVDPGVTDGAVIVDIAPKEPLPASARPQLQVEGTIYITQFPDTLYVGKPAYVKSDSEITVYKLDASGRYAQRTVIKVGAVSVNNIQITGGLKAGDRIITSDTNGWDNHDRILLN